jgi:hypothetical protein
MYKGNMPFAANLFICEKYNLKYIFSAIFYLIGLSTIFESEGYLTFKQSLLFLVISGETRLLNGTYA